MNTIKEQFLNKICEQPEDVLTKQAFVDFLLDTGDEKEAKAWKWVIVNKKRPTRGYSRGHWWDWLPWGWHRDFEKHFQYCELDDRYFRNLVWNEEANFKSARYKTQQESWLDLIRVLVENLT